MVLCALCVCGCDPWSWPHCEELMYIEEEWMPHDVANATLQTKEEAHDPQVESQRAPLLGSLA